MKNTKGGGASLPLVLCFMLSLGAYAEVRRDTVVDDLKGKQAVALVAIGSKGIVPGITQPCPVNTLAYPDGRVEYRVEFGLVRGSVSLMQKSFRRGSTLKIESVDVKDDRLEVKLTSGDNDSGRLKLMLGAGWQKTMSDEAVAQALGHFLQIPMNATQATASAGDQSAAAIPVPNADTIAPLIYARSPEAKSLPQRLTVADVNEALSGLAKEEEAVDGVVFQRSRSTSDGLLAFRFVYSTQRDYAALRLVDLIGQAQTAMGTRLAPRNAAEATSLDSLFRECRRMAQLRRIEDGAGREMGPGGNNAIFTSAFLSNRGDDARLGDVEALKTAIGQREALDVAGKQILAEESFYDSGDLKQAVAGYATLDAQNDASSSVKHYLEKSLGLREDVSTLIQAQAIVTDPSASIKECVATIAEQKNLLDQSADKPLSKNFLTGAIADSTAHLQTSVASLPIYRYPGGKSSDTSSLDLAQANNRLAALNESISAALPLYQVYIDIDTRDKIHLWLGDAVYSAMMDKARDMKAAALEGIALKNRADALQAAANEAEKRRKEEAEARAAAPDQMVNDAFTVTKMTEQFSVSHLMGYKLKAEEEKQDMQRLASKYRDVEFWKEVQVSFNRIIPGLTEEEMNFMQGLLSIARP